MIFLSFLIALVSSLLLHPQVVEIAKMKGITDNPDARKLQRNPVPVLGGIVVLFGIVMGLGFTTFFIHYTNFLLFIALMLVLLITGTVDDIRNLSPGLRFFIEICAALCLGFLGGIEITDFYGLWGIRDLPFWLSIIISVITVVGIINAINLVDGVDGLSSGYCIMACAVFAWYFSVTGNMALTSLALASVGALIPFFIYNVFGKKSKMLIGDGGTLLMGLILAIMVLCILTPGYTNPVFPGTPETVIHHDTLIAPHSSVSIPGTLGHHNLTSSLNYFPGGDTHFGIVAFTIAVLSFPICDTLRVMIMRIVHHRSPFSPDKTHLHHALIDCGFSHIQTTGTILSLNAFIILLWNILYRTGCSIDCQFYAVVGATIFLNILVYAICRHYRHNA